MGARPKRQGTEEILRDYLELVAQGEWRPGVLVAERYGLRPDEIYCMLYRARKRGDIPPAHPQKGRPTGGVEGLRARFVAKLGPPTESGCIPWMAASDVYGYGTIGLGGGDGGQGRATHVAWFLAHGEWPGEWMLHRCDNPPCVNVEHLFEGDPKANCHDMWGKGRAVPPPTYLGEANYAARLTAEQVQDIRTRLARGETGRSIAMFYGVSPSTVSLIKRGRKWAWLPLAG